MVHALRETSRVLVPSGVLIDTRPVTVPTALEVSVRGQWVEVFDFDVTPGIADDAAVEHAIDSVVCAGDFVPEAEASFVSALYWDSTAELYAQANQIGFRRFSSPADADLAKVERLMDEAGPGTRIRLQDQILMSC